MDNDLCTEYLGLTVCDIYLGKLDHCFCDLSLCIAEPELSILAVFSRCACLCLSILNVAVFLVLDEYVLSIVNAYCTVRYAEIYLRLYYLIVCVIIVYCGLDKIVVSV